MRPLSGLALTLLTTTWACAPSPSITAPPLPAYLAALPAASETSDVASHAHHVAELQASGSAETPQGRQWIDQARRAVHAPSPAPVPLREIVYFDPATPTAVGYAMNLDPGQTLFVRVRPIDGDHASAYLDVFAADTSRLERVLSTQGLGFRLEVARPGRHVLRVQPPLGRGGRFEVTLERRGAAGLAFPVRGKGIDDIRSTFGDPRDGGRRKHEGVDIFADRGTPVVAAAAGRVQQAGRNRLGGNMVWVGHDDRPYSTYYAHLDRVLVREGQRVEAGDRLGTVGNTGNARHAPPHLHFGLYRDDTALDPLPRLARDETPPPVVADPGWLRGALRVDASAAHLREAPSTDAAALGRLRRGEEVHPVAAREAWFRVRSPDGRWGWMHQSVLRPSARRRVAQAGPAPR